MSILYTTAEEYKKIIVSFVGHHEYAIGIREVEEANLMPTKKMRSFIEELIDDGTLFHDRRNGKRYIWLPGMKLPLPLEIKQKELVILDALNNKQMTQDKISEYTGIDIYEVRKLVNALVHRTYIYRQKTLKLTLTSIGRNYLERVMNGVKERNAKVETQDVNNIIHSLCTKTSSPVVSAGTFLHASI